MVDRGSLRRDDATDDEAVAPVCPRRNGSALGALASVLATKWIADGPGGRHRHLEGSLVSADLSGFTAMSERLAVRGREGSERLTSTVNSCFTVLIDAAAREGGDVVKFGGDALLLWFDGPDHEVRAGRAAARMQRSIRAPRFARAGLRMSVGAHAGAFDFFLVGRDDWRELVVVGRAATTTVDLEAAAGAGDVLVSAALAAALPPSWCAGRRSGGVVLDLDAIPLPRRPAPEADLIDTPELIAPTLRSDVTALANTAGEHRLATIVFAALEGTDESLERRGPDAFAESVDALVRAAQGASDRFGVQFLYTDVVADGIKLICAAGAPRVSGDDEEAALRFATELVSNDPERKLRAGVNRGRVFAGFLGSPTRRTYTVMGDPVNLAARLMGTAAPGEVVASAGTIAHSRALFETAALAPFLVKGKSEPIEAVVVGAPSGRTRDREGGAMPLVGRETELRLLRRAIGEAAGGMGQVVELVGDAGIGKTRLLEAVADDSRILIRVRSECQPYDVLSPYSSAQTLVRRAFGIPEEADSRTAGKALASTVERVAPRLRPLLPLLAVPAGADVAATPEADAIADEFRADRTHEVTVELLIEVLTVPTMLIVEDVYYVDDASLRLLQALAAEAPRRPWLLAVTRRPEGPGLVVGPVDGTLVKLSPLDDDVAARLAALAVGDRPVGTVDLEAMARRSGGNPLFVLQLADAAGRGVAADQLPESIERLVASRIDRLDPADRSVLRQAAVVGRVFHTSLLNMLRITEGSSAIEPGRWAHLADLIEPQGERRWRFRHALYRDVAYEGLPFARRKRMHAAVGELLEAGVAGEPDTGLLSQHFWLAGDAERTWRYSVAAGDEAWAKYAVAEAIAAYRRALGVRRRLRGVVGPDAVSQVAEVLGDVLERAARYDEALEAYRVARSGLSVATDPAHSRLLRKCGVVFARAADHERASRWLRRAIRATDHDTGPAAVRERGRTQLEFAALAYRQGKQSLTTRWADAALETGASVDDLPTIASASNLRQVAINHVSPNGNTEDGERALALFEELGDVHSAGKALNNLGVNAHYTGEWELASRRYSAAQQAFEVSGDVTEAAITANNLGEILCDQGLHEAAEERFALALRTWSASRFLLGVGLAHANLAKVAMRSGRPAKAEEHLDEAAEVFESIGSAGFVLEARVRRAEAALLAGRADAAIAFARAVLTDAASGEAYPNTVASAHRILGWAQLQLDRTDDARPSLQRGRAIAEDDGNRYELALCLRGLAALHQRVGDTSADDLDGLATTLFHQLGVAHEPRVPLPM